MGWIEIEIKNEDQELVGKEDINISQINSIRTWKDKKDEKSPHTLIVMANGKRYIIAEDKKDFKERARKITENEKEAEVLD